MISFTWCELLFEYSFFPLFF